MIFSQVYDWIQQSGYHKIALLLAGIAFASCVVAVALKGVLYRWFVAFFTSHAQCDETIRKRLFRYARQFALLTPLLFGICGCWVALCTHGRLIFGVHGGVYIGVLVLLVQSVFMWRAFSIVHYFSTCYNQMTDSARRPIRTVVILIYWLLAIWMAAGTLAVLTQQRPIVILSSFGAAAALFLFAFQNLITSLVASVQVNSERIVKVGDWIMNDAHKIDGEVEQITTHTIKVRNWDKTLVSFPIRLLMDETIVNYQAMLTSGLRLIERSLLIDQQGIRFLTADEVAELKKLGLVTDGMLGRCDAFNTAEQLSDAPVWTNIELFTLYVENYLQRRPDLAHDRWCFVRTLAPTPQGLPLELFCYSKENFFVEYETVQRAVFFHLIAVLPAFGLRLYQRSSDAQPERGDT